MTRRIPSLVLCATLLAVAAPCTGNAQTNAPATFADALRAGQDVVVFVHGSDWSPEGEAYRRAVWENVAFPRALGPGFTHFTIDRVQSATEEQRAAARAREKGFEARLTSLPGVALVDTSGLTYLSLPGPELPATAAGLAARLREARARRVQRDALIAQAAGATGVARARLLGRAAEAGAGRPKRLLDEIKKADPQDVSGYGARLGFDAWGTMGRARGLAQEKKHDEALRELDALLANPAYLPDQRQQILAARAGVLRQLPDRTDELARTYDQMIRLGPDTLLGRAAKSARALWASPLTLDGGWERRHLPRPGWNTWTLDAAGRFRGTGAYEVVFTHIGGADRLDIRRVALLDGPREVAADSHAGFAGRPSSLPVYQLNVPRVPARPRLVIEVSAGERRDTRGTITVRRASP